MFFAVCTVFLQADVTDLPNIMETICNDDDWYLLFLICSLLLLLVIAVLYRKNRQIAKELDRLTKEYKSLDTEVKTAAKKQYF